MAELRWLRIAAWVEAGSLVILVVNLLTVHAEALTSGVGPLHGFAWLVTIAVAFLAPLPRSARLCALIPGVGGLLATRRARVRSATGSGAFGPTRPAAGTTNVGYGER